MIVKQFWSEPECRCCMATELLPTNSISSPGSNAAEISCICWFQLQLTLLSTNSISLPTRRKSSVFSFFSCLFISTLSVVPFVDFAFYSQQYLVARIHFERAASDGATMCAWVLVCIYRIRFSCNYPLRVCAAGLSVWSCPYVYLYVCVYVYIYIYVYMWPKKCMFCILPVVIHRKSLYNASS